VRFVHDEEVVMRGVTVPFEREIPGFDEPDYNNWPFSPQLPIPDPNTQPSSIKSSDPTVKTGGVEPEINPSGEPVSTNDKGGREKHVRRESAYIQHLCNGEGRASNLPKGCTMLKGL